MASMKSIGIFLFKQRFSKKEKNGAEQKKGLDYYMKKTHEHLVNAYSNIKLPRFGILGTQGAYYYALSMQNLSDGTGFKVEWARAAGKTNSSDAKAASSGEAAASSSSVAAEAAKQAEKLLPSYPDSYPVATISFDMTNPERGIAVNYPGKEVHYSLARFDQAISDICEIIATKPGWPDLISLNTLQPKDRYAKTRNYKTA